MKKKYLLFGYFMYLVLRLVRVWVFFCSILFILFIVILNLLVISLVGFWFVIDYRSISICFIGGIGCLFLLFLVGIFFVLIIFLYKNLDVFFVIRKWLRNLFGAYAEIVILK